MRYDASNYDPEQDGCFRPIPAGEYFFQVQDARSATSSNGNEMIELELSVTIPGREEPVTVYDRLVAVPTALWKVHTFCAATGLDFSANELLPEHCLDQRGRAYFNLGEPNQRGRRYLQVARYLAPDENEQGQNKKQQPQVRPAPTAADPAAKSAADDDIPF